MSGTIGAFIFPMVWESWSLDQALSMLKALQDFGVNTLATESETYRDDLIELAHRLNMRFVGGIACFSEHGRNHQPLNDHPELWPILENGERRPLMEWYIGVTPTVDYYRESRLAEIERIMRDHELDGMCLDFIRWPLHWELELRPGQPEPLQSSFDPHTVRRFLEFAGLEMPHHCNTVPKQASWILSEHRAKWTDFKCKVINDFVSAARERVRAHRGTTTQLGVYMVAAPAEERAYLVGQREADLTPVVDFLSPMVYHPVLHRTPAWVAETVDGIVQLAPGKVLPVVQVDSAEGKQMGSDWGPPVPVEDWKEVACHAGRRHDTLGMVAFTGTALFQDRRGEVMAECLSGDQLRPQ
jgi:hypothetical protein